VLHLPRLAFLCHGPDAREFLEGDFERALSWLSLLRMCLSDVPFISFVLCAHHDLCTPK
jgi:hypothetical protein